MKLTDVVPNIRVAWGSNTHQQELLTKDNVSPLYIEKFFYDESITLVCMELGRSWVTIGRSCRLMSFASEGGHPPIVTWSRAISRRGPYIDRYSNLLVLSRMLYYIRDHCYKLKLLHLIHDIETKIASPVYKSIKHPGHLIELSYED